MRTDGNRAEGVGVPLAPARYGHVLRTPRPATVQTGRDVVRYARPGAPTRPHGRTVRPLGSGLDSRQAADSARPALSGQDAAHRRRWAVSDQWHSGASGKIDEAAGDAECRALRAAKGLQAPAAVEPAVRLAITGYGQGEANINTLARAEIAAPVRASDCLTSSPGSGLI